MGKRAEALARAAQHAVIRVHSIDLHKPPCATESLGLQRTSALELVLRQTGACIQTALANDIGGAAFVGDGTAL